MAAHGSSIAALQSLQTTGLSNKADQSAFNVLEGLKLSNYSTTAAMGGSTASANTLATVAANYGLKTVVDQHSLDIAARITPLEVDTKVANALLGAVTAATLAETPPSLGRQRPDSLRPSAVDTLSEVDSKTEPLLGLDASITASYATNAALSASETTLHAILAELAALQLLLTRRPGRASPQASAPAMAACVCGAESSNSASTCAECGRQAAP